MYVDTSFGRWLRTRRRALDLTQAVLAKQVGCAVITIQKLEADERRPSRLLAEQLAASLRLTAYERAEMITLARAEPYHDTALVDAPQPLSIPRRQLTKLPTPLTNLIGRKQDSATVRSMLMRGDTRLLTLLGPPGIGKTRLSIEVAHAVQAAFTDGAYFVALAPLSDSTLVMTTIAETLGIKENAGQPMLDRLKSALHAQRVLLLLDNFEHLLDAAPLVVELLEACPGLKVLVTSRAALHVRGERLVTVPPLALPDLRQRFTHGKLARIPAVVLFVERAQAALPHFQLTAQNAAAVAAICVCLDGLPLAIELAATRVKLLPPEVLLERLEQRLTMLTDGGRDLPPRHRTLRAAIDWSYALLDDPEQRVFRRLGIFVGGCTLVAAEDVLADDPMTLLPDHTIFDGLTSLIDASLLKQEQGSNGVPRLMMLETIREYALEQLAICGETETLRRRHAEYYLKVAEAAEPQLYGPEQVAWSTRLEAEHDNLRAALAWSCSIQDDQSLSLRLTSALSWFWILRSHYSEGRRWHDTLIDRHASSTPSARAKLLRAAGMLAENHGEFVRSIALLEESLALYRSLHDAAGAAEALLFLGRIKHWQGRYTEARLLLLESLALSQAQQNSWMSYIWSILSLGDTFFNNAELQQAQEYAQQALTISTTQGDKYAIAWAIAKLGRVAHVADDDSLAQAYYTEALALFRQLGNRHDIAAVYLDWGRVARIQGDVAQARRHYAESLTVFGEAMDRRGVPECIEGIAALAGIVGQPVRAALLFSAAHAWRQTVDLPLPPVYRATHERDLAAARTQLDEAAWTTAWAEGQVLSFERVIREAETILA